MKNNEPNLKLTGLLNKQSSRKQINSSIKELEKAVHTIRLTALLAKGESKQQLKLSVKQLESQLTQIKLKAKIDKKELTSEIDRAFNSLSFKEIEAGISSGKTKLKIQKLIAYAKKAIQDTPVPLSLNLKINSLENFFDRLGSAFQMVGMTAGSFQKSLKTIQKNNLTLAKISVANHYTESETKNLGSASYSTASKYGMLSSDYLSAIHGFNNQGFYGKKGKSLGELSLKAQAAGSLSPETAQNYLLAANAAYNYKEDAKKLSDVLDGQIALASKYHVSLETMASVMEKAGSAASDAGIKINELSALAGTISENTKQDGAAIGEGIQSIILALQDISSDKIANTLQKANIAMAETAGSAEKLLSSVDILKDLSKAYNMLDEEAPLKNEITENIGQGHPEQLAALLAGWQKYENMLAVYSSGRGSAIETAGQSAQNLTGTLNTLSNSWTEFVNSIIHSDALKTGSALIDNIIQHASELIPTLSPLGTLGLEAGLSMGFKNTGKRRMSVRIS